MGEDLLTRASVWEKKGGKERTASGEAALTFPLPILGPERDQGLPPCTRLWTLHLAHRMEVSVGPQCLS